MPGIGGLVLIFTARRYATARCQSVRQKPALYRNVWTYRGDFRQTSAYATLCYKRIRVSPKNKDKSFWNL